MQNMTIVIKFKKKLDPPIQNKVVLTGDSAPDFNNSGEWYEATWKVVHNREVNEAFMELNRNASHITTRPLTLMPKATSSPTYTFRTLGKINFPTLLMPLTCGFRTAPSNSKDGPELMDVDQALD